MPAAEAKVRAPLGQVDAAGSFVSFGQVASGKRVTDLAIVDDGDRSVRAGEAGVQVTWMDAKIGDWVVFPRYESQVFSWRGVAMMTIYDDAVQMVVDDPSEVLAGHKV